MKLNNPKIFEESTLEVRGRVTSLRSSLIERITLPNGQWLSFIEQIIQYDTLIFFFLLKNNNKFNNQILRQNCSATVVPCHNYT